MNEEKKWFLLKPHIYVSDKDKSMLLYDTLSGTSLQIVDKDVISMVRNLYADDNLGSIEVTRDLLDIPSMKSFLDNVVQQGMGELVVLKSKPVALFPILSLNSDIDKLQNKDNVDFLLAKDISKNLLELTIMLNDICEQECGGCMEYSRQFICCGKGKGIHSIDREILSGLFAQLAHFPSCNINIIGGDIYRYESLELLDDIGVNGINSINVYTHYLNYRVNPYIDKYQVHLMVNYPVNEARLEEVVSQVRGRSVRYHLIVEDDFQFQELERLMLHLGVDDFEVHPFYNGINTSFFEANVYLEEEDILERPISMREIFRNQKMNANFFGSLYVLPDGTVKASLNEKVVGNLRNDSVLDIIYNEMMENTTWRKVRSGRPCNACVYQYLCPPPSNYERMMGKSNLCHVTE